MMTDGESRSEKVEYELRNQETGRSERSLGDPVRATGLDPLVPASAVPVEVSAGRLAERAAEADGALRRHAEVGRIVVDAQLAAVPAVRAA